MFKLTQCKPGHVLQLTRDVGRVHFLILHYLSHPGPTCHSFNKPHFILLGLFGIHPRWLHHGSIYIVEGRDHTITLQAHGILGMNEPLELSFADCKLLDLYYPPAHDDVDPSRFVALHWGWAEVVREQKWDVYATLPPKHDVLYMLPRFPNKDEVFINPDIRVYLEHQKVMEMYQRVCIALSVIKYVRAFAS